MALAGWVSHGLQHVLAMFVANLVHHDHCAAPLPEDLRATPFRTPCSSPASAPSAAVPAVAVGSGLPIVRASASPSFRGLHHCGDPGPGARGAVIVGGLSRAAGFVRPLVAAHHHTHRGGRGGDPIGFAAGVGAASFGGGPARILAALQSSSAPSRFWRALCSRVSPRHCSHRCSSVVGYLGPSSRRLLRIRHSAALPLPGAARDAEFNLGAIITVTLIFLYPPPRPWATARRSRSPRCAATPRTRSSLALTADGLVSSLAGVRLLAGHPFS
ncbi:MAG: hypothetical protein ACLSDQ_11580 [Adlercreutzia equolifaciens]